MTARAKFLIVLLCLISLSSFAQTIKLTGRITNQKNEAIAGASIQIEGTSIGTAADVEGRFSLNLEQGKKYVLLVSATGYKAKAIAEIEVGNGQDNTISVVLEESKQTELTGVVIRTTRRQESTVALLNFQKNNTALSSGLAADFIRRTPDKNTGEVLKRVSGTSVQDNKFVVIRGLADRYNSAYINGAQLPSSEPDKKAFSFDVIPSQLIDNIIINKTATPNLTGEFAGGLVQVTTKDIPVKKELVLGIGLGFNLQASFKDFYSNPRGKNEWLGFSDRKLPSGWPKSATDYNSLSADEKVALAHTLSDDVYRQQKSSAGPIQNYSLTWANVAKGKNGSSFGSILGVTYRQSKLVYDGKNAVRKSFPPDVFEYSDNQNRYSVNWGAVANFAYTKGKHKIAFKNLFNQLLDDNYYVRSGTTEHNPMRLYSSVLNQRSLYSTQLEGNHGIGKLKFEWNVNYSHNKKDQPDLRVMSYAVSDVNPNDITLNNRGNNTNRFFSDLKDDAFGYSAALSIPFKYFNQNQTLKIGGSSIVRLRDFRATILGIEDPADHSLLSLPYDQIFNHDNFRTGGFIYTAALQNPSDKYYGISALNAGYIMFDNKLSDKVRLVWGARAENFQQFIKSNDARKGDTAVVILTEKLDILPSFNLTISPTIKTNIRIAGSQTVARPEFREIAPFAFYDFEQLASVSGNPDLVRSSILNGDIRYEMYPGAGELLSLGGFFKYFNDPIELRLDEGSVPSRRQYIFQNGDNAKLIGAELEFRKNFSFLSEKAAWLKKLYFNGNATFIFSKVTLNTVGGSGHNVTTSRPLQGQSPYLVNAGFQYEGDDLSASLLYNRIGQRLSLVGNATMPDIYENARNLVDLQVAKKVFKRNGEVRLTVSDIFNQRIMLYQNIDKAKVYKENTDLIFSSFRPGTTMTLSFNYNFKL
ncbi:MAG TPA: carboxypeptidase-like regulatory domain-containing protein [Chitinophagaceae bacterium]